MSVVEPEAAYIVQKSPAHTRDVKNFTASQGQISIPPLSNIIHPDAQTLDYQVGQLRCPKDQINATQTVITIVFSCTHDFVFHANSSMLPILTMLFIESFFSPTLNTLRRYTSVWQCFFSVVTKL